MKLAPQMEENASSVLGSNGLRLGRLEVRLAQDEAEILAAQQLRFRVFYEEMGAHPQADMAARKTDYDSLDQYCDHLIVIDHNAASAPEAIIGTYRLIRREAAKRHGGFYSSGEYDISRLEAFPGEILEVGRSCVHQSFRNRPTMQLLWRGIADYIAAYGVDILFGCASLPGTDPKALAVPLSYLYHYHLAAPSLRPVALPHRYVDMRLMDPASISIEQGLSQLRLFSELPPLLKGYLRLGGFVGDGAVVDEQFNTTDVCVLVKTDLIAERYSRHYDLKSRDGLP
ncbi:MAG TPA: GNAT family N-acyltransferase [Alphaproteobacteria bacterium]|nr:GNAT family N-acyltransferase [Alphaproteobacteria bacterium]